MKKTLLLLFTITSLQIFSQGLTISTDTPQQLSNKIINTNCITTSNWSTVSGSNFGNANSVGTFTRPANVNFPFSNGVVLSTGNINNVPGPKLLPNYIGDGTPAWPSDADMNTTVGSTNFTNASALEFNFTSQLTTFKLNYVFASEEYGSNQCDLTASDAMVILLYDLTSGTSPINIATTAVTNQIVSVSTIRENTYNTSCSDVNQALFGAFYDAPNDISAPINFFGRTISMTASATIDPTHTYRVKIVVADRNDIQYDSAVFIEQYIQQYQAQNVLGGDLTVANNNAQCEGSSVIINTGLSPTNTYLWRKDGVAITGANGPSYTIPSGEAIGTHTYNVVCTFDNCSNPDGIFDSILIEFLPPVITPNPNNLFRCVGDTTPYNLFQNTPVISAGLTYTPIVTYHTSQANADNDFTPSLTQNYSGPLTTIFVRIEQPGNPCPAIKSFTLGTTNPPSNISTPQPLELCSRTPTILNAITNLGSLNTEILNGQSPSTFGVSYHNSQNGADTNTDTILLDGTGLAIIPTTLTTIFVRVYVIGSQNCFTTTSFPVTISPLLGVDKPENVVYCGPSYILPPLTNGKYYSNPYDGVNPNSQLPELFAGQPISIPAGHIGTYTQTVYISNPITTSAPCSEEHQLQITLIQPTTFAETNTTVCDNYLLPILIHGSYWTEANGTGTEIPGGTLLTTTTTIYYNFESTINTPENPSCNVSAGPVTITIEQKPDLGPDRQNVFTCNPPYILPPLNIDYPGAKYYSGPGETGIQFAEGTPINSSQDIYVYIEDTTGTLGCPNEDYFRVVVGLDPITDITECTYILPQPSAGKYYSGPGGTGIEYPVGYNVENSIMPIYLYVAPPPGETCAPGQNETSFNIIVTHPPVDTIPGFVSPNCGNFTLPSLTNGKYYTESHWNGGTGGTEISAGTIISSNQTIYIYNFTPGTTPLCDFEVRYDFIINPIPLIDTSVNTLIDLCNISSYTLPILTEGNYYTGIGGTGQLLNTPELRVISGPFPVSIYIYNVDTTTGCENERAIRITSSITLADDPVNSIEEACSTFNLPNLTVSGSRYHRSYWDPTDPNNTSSTPPAGIVIPDPSVWAMPDPTQPFYDHTIYIYNSTLDGVRETCPINKPIRIILYRQPTVTKPNNVYVCGNSYVLPALPLGQKYYKESHLLGGTVFTELTGTLTENQRVYIYEENLSIIPNSTFKCFDEEFFDIEFFNVDTGTDILGCGSITLPTLTSGSYYYGPNGTNPITNNEINYSASETYPKLIHIFGLSPFPAGECPSMDNTFEITLTPSPTINPIPLYDADPLVIDRTYCDTDDTNDGVLNIDLTQYNSTILGTQTGNEFSVTYHNSIDDALNNLNPITETLSNNQTLYSIVRNSNFTCTSTPMKIDFVVNLLPEPDPQDVFLCINNITGLPISAEIINSGLLTGNYIFEWKDENGIVVGNSNTLVSNTSGDYTLTVTDIDPTKGCVSVVRTVSVLESSIAITGYTITQDFSDNQIITVIPDGYGDNYVYQLDGGLFQESNVFTNVPSGNHEIVIRDKNGCGDSTPINVLVLQYPKFFTPNSDGYNDYWNIYDLQELGDPNAKISIFDRQGKLLKQISPFGIGWDGMHNGNPLFADDYWFVVNYTREGISREFKSHFSIKR